MTVYDKLKLQLLEDKREGRLHPGDKLPPYRELMVQYGCSYATAQSACRKLQDDGILELRHGSGVYVSGLKPLKVRFYVTASSLDMGAYRDLIMKYVKRKELHVDVELMDRMVLRPDEPQGFITPDDDCKVILVEANEGHQINISGLVNWENYEGYEALRKSFRNLPAMDLAVSLPYYYFNTRLGINARLFRQIGIDPERINGGDFSWWDELVAACRRYDVCPASFLWNDHDTWPVYVFYYPLLAMLIDEIGELPKTGRPFFSTEAGRLVFEMMAGHDLNPDRENLLRSFEHGNSAVSFVVGSWFSAYMKACSQEPIEDFKVIPYTHHGKPINFLHMTRLMTYWAPNTNPDERQRIWELQRLLLGKEFQIEFCRLIGAFSPLRSVRPEDCADCQCPVMRNLIPSEDSIDVWDAPFSKDKTAVLAALFSQYRFHGAELNQILKTLDDFFIGKRD